jgi:poly-gamma-glutamate capsule biosynthesis protein CapA/YwtB (metallophosphatase superfamily)
MSQSSSHPHRSATDEAGTVTLFLCGDVMTGRGIDQILSHPSAPNLHEHYVRDASIYVKLAEDVSGAISTPVEASYLWGEALQELDRVSPDARIINLETSITTSEDYWREKGIHYRMHPANVTSLTVVHPDVVVLANNHVLDYGYDSLAETLATLRQAGIETTGAGCNLDEAQRPATIRVRRTNVILVFGLGTEDSGVLPTWSALEHRPGVNLLDSLSERAVLALGERMRAAKRPGDLVVASIHWGSNWGYEVPTAHTRFAHRLIDLGVDLVHGHSSHHPRPIEVYDGKLILYGCGDFINDYEGIRGYEKFRDELRLMYFTQLDALTGSLAQLRMVPMKSVRLQLTRTAREDAEWLSRTLTKASLRFGTRTTLLRDDSLLLEWK